MYMLLFVLLQLAGYFATGYGAYEYFIKKDRVRGNHVWAYTFFVFALGSAMISDYVGMAIAEGIAIYYFVRYVKMKEA